MSMILDGKKVAGEKKAIVAERVEKLAEKGIKPGLAFVAVGADEASLSYLRSQERACKKVGITPQTLRLAETITAEDLLNQLFKLNEADDVHGIIVTLPLPGQLNEERILSAIAPYKDVDCLSPANRGLLAFGQSEFQPATPAGILSLLEAYEITVSGKHVVVLGRGKAVGWPLAQMLLTKEKMGNATVTVCHSRSGDLTRYTRIADILVAAIGRPKFVNSDFIHKDQVLVDAGINGEETPEGWKMSGDIDFNEVSDKVKAITPVPGGVGPMTVAMLLNNVTEAAERRI
ncbi:bifunctional methylenetetrahydrofolate dehydrogenase/methenyltetrahydrofolate cyclohydrolase [candidate division WOR-3 bacterium]|uniref:Bifunctional protein FolD n=1 Tax=candidate division WOR-3 bacterium TaxID=2052148 RepID=A0A9D5KA41_UNCW3|nr:bifunctional methylenetetrahydrofolate dehydrogenase/methenyltetrahydrofolate cyclohydrolase [candidate division WOR-3 bacterium]MBD3365257.1 bifunctional methylenetetrahydrofolate dehydrogenase/methenyltetrahydrofolate cyclohydrolase [candidate division WOR-3 bacterium]